MTDTSSIQIQKNAYPALSDVHGYGLFAKHAMTLGDVIDVSPVLKFGRCPAEIKSHVYKIRPGYGPISYALVLGDSVLCNSGDEPNARPMFIWDKKDRGVVVLLATRDIATDDEVLISYEGY